MDNQSNVASVVCQVGPAALPFIQGPFSNHVLYLFLLHPYTNDLHLRNPSENFIYLILFFF